MMSKKNQRKQERKKGNNLLLNVIKILLVIFLFTLIVLIIVDFNIVSSVRKIFEKPKPIVIQGECYSFMNTVLYQINSEDDCQKLCSDRCWVNKQNYQSSDFVLTPGSCNLCDCYCN